jgi:hypothetical protein
LLDGLLGYSIGALSKNIRFFLDKLMEQFPQYFRDTVLNVYKRQLVVTSKWQAYNRDLLKWRWKIIKKAEDLAAKEDQVCDVPEDHLAVIDEEFYDPLWNEDNYVALLADNEDESDNNVSPIDNKYEVGQQKRIMHDVPEILRW